METRNKISLSKVKFKTKLYYFSSDHLPIKKSFRFEFMFENSIKKNLDIVFTAVKSSRNPYFNMISKRKNKINIISKHFDKKNRKILSRRQDTPQCYDLTTACYVFKPNYVMQSNDLFSGKVDFVEIPRERGIDIDDDFDYKITKLLSQK